MKNERSCVVVVVDVVVSLMPFFELLGFLCIVACAYIIVACEQTNISPPLIFNFLIVHISRADIRCRSYSRILQTLYVCGRRNA